MSPVSEEADDAHAGGDEQVVELVLVLVVGGGRGVPALEAAEHYLDTQSVKLCDGLNHDHYLGAVEAGHGGLHSLEAVRAVLPHVLGQDVRHHGLLHRHHVTHCDVLRPGESDVTWGSVHCQGSPCWPRRIAPCSRRI